MALKPNRSILRASVQRELMDTTGKWFSATEVNSWLEDWQQELQQKFEFVWGTSTVAVGTATSTWTLATVAPLCMRLDRTYWGAHRLPTRTPQDLDLIDRGWRYYNTQPVPHLTYQQDPSVVCMWPAVSTAGTLTLEYPKVVTFGGVDADQTIPEWTRWSSIPYCAYRAYARLGPTQDLKRAARYKAGWGRWQLWIRKVVDNFWPERAPHLTPGGTYEHSIIEPPTVYGGFTVPGVITTNMAFQKITVSGTTNGVNPTFTLALTPTQAQVFVDGQLQTPSVDYALNGVTITFTSTSIPVSGAVVGCWGTPV